MRTSLSRGPPFRIPLRGGSGKGSACGAIGLLQPTVAGVVLFGVHPEALRPAWRVIALRIAGTDRSAPIVDRLETEGPAPLAIAQVEAFLRRNLAQAHTEGQEAQDTPLAAGLEAITNAVAHRDYAAASQVFVRLYADRLEIESPGGLLAGASPDQVLAGGDSHPRIRLSPGRCAAWASWRKPGAGWRS